MLLTACVSGTGSPSASPSAPSSGSSSSGSSDRSGTIPLKSFDLSDDTPIFEPVAETAIAQFENVAKELNVPNLRKGESYIDFADLAHTKAAVPAVALLGQIPSQNIYVFGCYTAEQKEFGIVIDCGAEQSLYYFPYRYTGTTLTPPLIDYDPVEQKLYLISYTGTGSSRRGTELVIFTIADQAVTDQYIVPEKIIDEVAGSISAFYDAESTSVLFGAGESFVTAALAAPFGVDPTKAGPPHFFDCSTSFAIQMRDHIPYLICMPVIKSEDGIAVYYPEPSVTITAKLTVTDDDAVDWIVDTVSITSEAPAFSLSSSGFYADTNSFDNSSALASAFAD